MKIIYDTDNDCVGCPQGCIRCGRGDYLIAKSIICDECGKEVETVYDTNDGRVCAACVLKMFEKITLDDINDNTDAYENETWVHCKKWEK